MSKGTEILELLSFTTVSAFVSWLGILSEIVSLFIFGGCFAVYAGLLVFTVGLREMQTNLNIREIGKNLFKKLF